MKSVVLLLAVALVGCESSTILDYASMMNGVFLGGESESCQPELQPNDYFETIKAVPLNKPNEAPGSHIFYMVVRGGRILTANIQVVTENQNGSLDIKSHKIPNPPLNSDGAIDMEQVAQLDVSELTYVEKCNKIDFRQVDDGVFVGTWPVCRGPHVPPTVSQVTLTCDYLQFNSRKFGFSQGCGRSPVMNGDEEYNGPCSN